MYVPDIINLVTSLSSKTVSNLLSSLSRVPFLTGHGLHMHVASQKFFVQDKLGI